MILKTCWTKELDEARRAAIVSLCTESHGVDFSLLFSYLPPDGLHTLAYAGGQLVSHAVATTRWLQPGDHPLLKTAYVDAVATHPAYQRQGIGSALMHHLALAIAGYELGCLETERASFYARLGWERWQGPLAGRKEGELILTPEQEGVMILRLAATPDLDLKSRLIVEHDGRIW